MAAHDDHIRADLLSHVRSLAIDAIHRFEYAGSKEQADAAIADMHRLKVWLDWLTTATSAPSS